MNADYRVKEIFTEEETGDVIALCYDVLYGETFEKYLGQGDTYDGKENASNLLKDSNYEISDEIRADIEDIFSVREFDAENDYSYDGYQFYDFDDEDDEFEDEDDFAVPTSVLKKESFNLREALNQIDLNTYNKYDLLNLYEACNLSENEKRALANIVYDQNDPSVIYDTLNDRFLGKEIEMPERVKDGVIHEDTNTTYTAFVYSEDDKITASDLYTFNDKDEAIKFAMENDWDEVINDETGDVVFAKPVEDDMGTYFDDIQPELEESVKKSLTEGFYRGCKGVTMIGHGSWSDPELEYNGYIFNYWDIENALWNDFLDETGWTDVSGDEPVVEKEFNEYVQKRCVDYLDDCIYGGAFTGLSIDGNIIDFPNGDYYYVGYKDGKISLDNAYNAGRAPEYSIDYDFEESIDTNLQRLYDHAIEKSPRLAQDEFDESLSESKSINENTSLEGTIKLIDDFYYDSVQNIRDADWDKVLELFEENGWISGDDMVIPKGTRLRKVDYNLYYNLYEIVGNSNSENIPIRIEQENDIPYVAFENEEQPKPQIEPTNESINEDEPYTKEQIEQDLKSITKNFTSKEGELKCGFVEEKNSAVEILRQHYRVVETSGDDRREGTWYHISYANPIIKESNSVDDELETAEQKISSANTSINSSKLPAIFNRVKFVPGELNLDFGGGKFDNATEFLAQQGVESLVYDPYNRTSEHNAEVLARVRENGGADTITLSNVLNVIAEPEARLAVLRNCKRLLKSGGTLYITVYEGTGKGDERETKAGYQLNRKTDGYIDEISSVFSDVTPKGKLIIAK